MLRGYKFRIYPTKKEIEELNKQMSLAKRLYNLLLEKARSYYKETGKAFTRNNMNNILWNINWFRYRIHCKLYVSQLARCSGIAAAAIAIAVRLPSIRNALNARTSIIHSMLLFFTPAFALSNITVTG